MEKKESINAEVIFSAWIYHVVYLHKMVQWISEPRKNSWVYDKLQNSNLWQPEPDYIENVPQNKAVGKMVTIHPSEKKINSINW